MKKQLSSEDLLMLWRRFQSLGFMFNFMALSVVVIVTFLILNIGVAAGQLALHYRVASAKVEIFDSMSHTRPNPPSQQRYKFLAEELAAFEPLASQLEEKNFIWRKFDYSDKDRLEFKERLFSSRQSFKKLSEERHVVFEESAQLPDFDQLLPSKDELPQLFMNLELSEELRRALIGSGASYVHELNFPRADIQDFGKTVKRYTYAHVAVFYTNWPGLLSFLRDLAQSENLWHFEKIIIENKPQENSVEKPPVQGQDSASSGTVTPPDAPLHVNLVSTGTFYARNKSS